jgi:hypothetical protein
VAVGKDCGTLPPVGHDGCAITACKAQSILYIKLRSIASGKALAQLQAVCESTACQLQLV